MTTTNATPATTSTPKRVGWLQQKAGTGEWYFATWEAATKKTRRPGKLHPATAGKRDAAAEAKAKGWTVVGTPAEAGK